MTRAFTTIVVTGFEHSIVNMSLVPLAPQRGAPIAGGGMLADLAVSFARASFRGLRR